MNMNPKILFIGLISLMMLESSYCISTMAIDIGSEFTKVAIVKPGVPMEIALDKESQRKTPTVVSIRNGERSFGTPALNIAVKFPASAFVYIPTIIGKSIKHPSVQQYIKRYPFYSLREDETSGQLIFKHEDTEYTAEELLAMILDNARETAEAFANQGPLKDCAIVVPTFFTQAERRAVLRSASLIGLNVLQLMNSNTAVALNYGIFRRKSFNTTAQYYMFYDLGSSTTSATIVSYQMVKTREGAYMEDNPQLSIIGVGFNPNLGATSFIFRLRDHLAKIFNDQKKTKKDVTSQPRAMAKLFKEATRVMRVLSANNDIYAQIENLLDDQDFKAKVSRSEFEEMCNDLFDQVTKPLDDALNAAQIPFPLIKEIILMGGGSRIPKVHEFLLKSSGKDELGKSVNTDEAAALGAVYQAAYRSPGFRVMKFVVRDATLYPIQVDFERVKPSQAGSVDTDTPQKQRVQRTLFNHMNPYPQKKVLTFNKQSSDFEFFVGYGLLDKIQNSDYLSGTNLTHVTLTGVQKAHDKHLLKASTSNADSSKQKSANGDDASSSNKKTEEDTPAKSKPLPDIEAKGVKAHFSVDESGLFKLDSVEALFQKSPESAARDAAEANQSTFEKLGKTITNLFGGSEEAKPTDTEADYKKAEDKTDDKPKDETKDEKKSAEQENKKTTESSEKEDNSKSKTADNSTSTNSSATNKTEEAKKSNKPVLLSEHITHTVVYVDAKEPNVDSIDSSIKKLDKLRDLDIEKRNLEKSKNELESFIFENKDRLYRDEYALCSTEKEREDIVAKLNAASDWYEDQGMDTLKQAYEKKLSELKGLTKVIEHRVAEKRARPVALKMLADVVNTSEIFYSSSANFTGEGNIFTTTEIESLHKVMLTSKAFLEAKKAEDKTMKLDETPSFLAVDLNPHISALEREIRYLYTKVELWKANPPKPVATNTTASDGNTTSSNAEGTDNTANSTSSTSQDTHAQKAQDKHAAKVEKPEDKSSDDTTSVPPTSKDDEEHGGEL